MILLMMKKNYGVLLSTYRWGISSPNVNVTCFTATGMWGPRAGASLAWSAVCTFAPASPVAWIPNDSGGATEKLASPPRVVELSPHDKATALLLEDWKTA